MQLNKKNIYKKKHVTSGGIHLRDKTAFSLNTYTKKLFKNVSRYIKNGPHANHKEKQCFWGDVHVCCINDKENHKHPEKVGLAISHRKVKN